MELCEILYNKAEYIETASGNKVSRQSVLCGSQNIVLNGKTIVMNDCIIRGDLANVRVGRQCVIKSRSVIRPPFKKFSKGLHVTDSRSDYPSGSVLVAMPTCGLLPFAHWRPRVHRGGLRGQRSADRLLRPHREKLCHWATVCSEGLLQDSGQHGPPARDSGAALHSILRLSRPVFRRAARVHTGAHDRCHQELLPEVPPSQPDLKAFRTPLSMDQCRFSCLFSPSASRSPESPPPPPRGPHPHSPRTVMRPETHPMTNEETGTFSFYHRPV